MKTKIENPLLRFQLRKILRWGLFFWLFLPWMALNVALRSIPDSMQTTAFVYQSAYLLMNFIGFVFRADNFAVIFLLWHLLPGRDWERLRRDLSVTLISARSLVWAFVAGPVALLVIYNLIAARYVYDFLLTISGSMGALLGLSPTGQLVYAWSMIVSATLEDCFFCTICVLAALWMRLDTNRSSGSAAMRGFFVTICAGLAMGGIALIWNLFEAILSGSETLWFTGTVFGIALNSLFMLGAEAGIIWFLHRKCVRAAEGWLAAE
ncbi:hypothetical protein BH09SUM1_BH09SUM1_01510 [soil metagenome]